MEKKCASYIRTIRCTPNSLPNLGGKCILESKKYGSYLKEKFIIIPISNLILDTVYTYTCIRVSVCVHVCLRCIEDSNPTSTSLTNRTRCCKRMGRKCG